MKSAEELKAVKVKTLDDAVRRPMMYGGTDFCIEVVLHNLLADLCFIDDREHELKTLCDTLEGRGVCRSTGIRGGFDRYIDSPVGFPNEVASILAELADQLGYLTPDRRLDKDEWTAFRKGLGKRLAAKDWRTTDVTTEFGSPSLNILSVYGYSSPTPEKKWVFFDFASKDRPWDREAFLLRNARLPAKHLTDELVFTPFGRSFRRKS